MPTPPLRAGRGGRGRGAAAPGGGSAAAADARRRQQTPQPAPDLGAAAVEPTPVPAWQPNIGGCESGFTIPDPTDADIVYASCYGNKVTRWDARTGTARSIEPWMVSLDSPPNEAKYRCHWTAPMAIDPFDHNNVLYGCQLILKTSNGGQSWTESQPRSLDQGSVAHRLERRHRRRQPRPVRRRGRLVDRVLEDPAGPDLGRHQRRQALVHEGRRRELERRHEELQGPAGPGARSIRSGRRPSIRARPTSPSRFHLMDDRKPYIYKTTDFGATWTKINGNIPTGHPLDYILSMSGNPNRKGMLFAGTGRAFYYSMDDGGTWTQFKDGLPPAPVSWITVEPRFHDVVDLDLRPRPLHPAQHHAARADGADRTAGAGHDEALSQPAPIVRHGAQRLPAGQPSALPARAGDRAGGAGEDGDPRRGRQGRSRRRWSRRIRA